MAFFRRAARGPAPAAPPFITAADLRRIGESALRTHMPDIGVDLTLRGYELTQTNRPLFFSTLQGLALEHGGVVAYGAERYLVDVVGGNLSDPAYDVIMDASIAFLRSRGVPPASCTGYEWEWWHAHRGEGEPWLIGKRPADRELDRVTDLAPDELRRVAVLTAEANSNVFFVGRDAGGGYTLWVDARQSDDDPTRSRWAFKTDDDLFDLYVEVGRSLQVPPHWADPELVPFIPLSAPDLS